MDHPMGLEVAVGRKIDLARRLFRVATIREAEARVDVVVAERAAKEKEDELLLIDELLEEEEEQVKSDEVVTGFWLQAVGVARQIAATQKSQTKNEVKECQEEVKRRRGAQLNKWKKKKTAEKVLERLDRGQRVEWDRMEQKELDEIAQRRFYDKKEQES